MKKEYIINDLGNERILIVGNKEYRTYYSRRIIELLIKRKGLKRATQYFTHKEKRAKFLDPLFNYLNSKTKNLKVLEVGCSSGHITEYLNEQRCIEEIYNYDYIYNKVLLRKQSMEDDFIEPLDISFLDFPSDITLKEITSEYMLKWAGHKLKNCINDRQQNYKGKIESGLCRLFLIETKNNLSAMHIKLEGLEYKIIQLLSYCNKETSVLHKTIGEIFIKQLTLVHLENKVL